MYHTIKNFKERYNLKYPYIFNPFSKRFQNKKNTLKTGFHYIFTPQLIKTALIDELWRAISTQVILYITPFLKNVLFRFIKG